MPHGIGRGGYKRLRAQGRMDRCKRDRRRPAPRSKVPAEQRFMRKAARVSDAAAEVALDAIARRRKRARSRGGLPERNDPAPAALIQDSVPSSARRRDSVRSTRRGPPRASPKATRVFLELSGCVARYHAPLGRLVHVGSAPGRRSRDGGRSAADAFDAVCEALTPGVALPRCLRRMAERRRRSRPCALPAAPLRLRGRYRHSAELDRRKQGHGPARTTAISWSKRG